MNDCTALTKTTPAALPATRESDPERVPDAIMLTRCKDRYRAQIFERQALMQAYQAEPNQYAVRAEYAARLGKSPGTLNRLYYEWRARGIAALAPKTAFRAPATDTGSILPPATVEWFRGIIESINAASVPQARRIMLQRIKRGEKVPGLGTWHDMWSAKFPNIPPPRGVEYPRGDLETILPRGLSARTMNKHQSELMERTAARQGTFVASHLGPMVYTTRVGLNPGQILMFDDVWHNQKVNWMGSQKALRVIELACYDVSSAHKVAWGARPRIWNPETKRHEIVKEHEFRLLLAYALCEGVGYRQDGTVLWLERGTAAIDDTLAAAIETLSGGAVTVKRAPLKDGRQLCSVFRSVGGGGNPNFKAPLESHHSVAHTVLSHLPGQVGRHADLCPQEISGRDKANELLLKIAALLPPEYAALMSMPYLHWDEYMQCVVHAYRELADRTWHNLEGWEQMKRYTREFCLPGYTDFFPMDSLQDMPPDAADKILDILNDHPEWCRIRPQSPLEVWNRHKAEMVFLPKPAMPLIMGPKNGLLRECPDTADLSFTSRELGPAPHIYSREYIDEHGESRRLLSGRPYMFHINPFSVARELYISTPDLSYVGVSQRINVPSRGDDQAFADEIKRKKAEWSRVAERVGGRALTRLANDALAQQRNAHLVAAAAAQGLLPGGNTPVDDPPQIRAQDDDADLAILEMSGYSRQ